MKLFGSCWRSSTVSNVVAEEAIISAANLDFPLLTCTRTNDHARASSKSATHWRPSLSAISEDAMTSSVGQRTERKKTVQSQNKGKSMAKARRCNRYDNRENRLYRNNNSLQIEKVIPAFTPAPFMF